MAEVPQRKLINNPEIEGEELLGPYRDPLPDEVLHPDDQNHHNLVPTRLYPKESKESQNKTK